eukprot:TRINITY_DN1898_c0_g2_i11.p2 TRINITY_DN1898_c0_g2~~TRINITY_DN1898_c0_g2_i11.p2  ORF type:complete len:173 (-),score=31.10 TRINITY_DN1898_c0_g2_i11:419-937(-)
MESKFGQQIRDNSRVFEQGQNGYYDDVHDSEQEQLEAAIMASLAGQSNVSKIETTSQLSGQNDTLVTEACQNEDIQIEELDKVDFDNVDRDTILELGFRLLDGTKISQKFLKNHQVGVLKDFIRIRLKVDLDTYSIASQFPRRVLSVQDSDKQLTEIGMEHRETFLFVKKDS